MPGSRLLKSGKRRPGSAASRGGTACRSAASPSPPAGDGWSWWRPWTTCSRARPPRPCRTSTWPWASTSSPPFPHRDGLPATEATQPRARPALRSHPMSDLLWQKPGVAVDAQIQAFLAGDDVILDREFFLHDIRASGAHARGRERIGILSADELAALERELRQLAEDFQ